MPYIAQDRRDLMSDEVMDGFPPSMNNAGELNFQLTLKILQYMEHHGLNYQTINDIVGALEGAKVEFCRRIVAKYEDAKIEQNGDLYPNHFPRTTPKKTGASRAKLSR
jgi:hypothetical protein